MPTPQIKDEKMYQALRRDGASKEKAARISNAAANTSRSKIGRKGGKARNYVDRTKEQLVKRARQLGVKNPSGMGKGKLIHTMRHH